MVAATEIQEIQTDDDEERKIINNLEEQYWTDVAMMEIFEHGATDDMDARTAYLANDLMRSYKEQQAEVKAANSGRRGRPRKYVIEERINRESEAYDGCLSVRALQNEVNAQNLICVLIEADVNYELYQFFASQDMDSARIRHKGIAEQIGRMMASGCIGDYEAIELARRCAYMVTYEHYSSKQVERMLRQQHKQLKKSVAATKNQDNESLMEAIDTRMQEL